MGRVYSDLGQKQKALELYNQALPIWRDVAESQAAKRSLSTISAECTPILVKTRRRWISYNQALPLWRQAGNRRGEAVTLTNYGQSLIPAWGSRAKRWSLITSRWRVARSRGPARRSVCSQQYRQRLFRAWGSSRRRCRSNSPHLSLAKDAADPDLQGGIETSLMIDFRDQNLPEEAIFFGMEAVNSFQQDSQEHHRTGSGSASRICAIEVGHLSPAGGAVWCKPTGWAKPNRFSICSKEQELKEVVRGAADDRGSQGRARGADRRPAKGAGRAGDSRARGARADRRERGICRAAGQGDAHSRRNRSTEGSGNEDRGAKCGGFRLFQEDALSGTGAAGRRAGCQRLIEQGEVGRQPLAEYAGGTGAARDGHPAAAGRADMRMRLL